MNTLSAILTACFVFWLLDAIMPRILRLAVAAYTRWHGRRLARRATKAANAAAPYSGQRIFVLEYVGGYRDGEAAVVVSTLEPVRVRVNGGWYVSDGRFSKTRAAWVPSLGQSLPLLQAVWEPESVEREADRSCRGKGAGQS